MNRENNLFSYKKYIIWTAFPMISVQFVYQKSYHVIIHKVVIKTIESLLIFLNEFLLIFDEQTSGRLLLVS